MADVEGVVLGRIVARVVVGQRGVDLPGETVDGKPFRPAVFIGNVIIDPDRVFFLETVEVADAARNGTVVAFGRRWLKRANRPASRRRCFCSACHPRTG